MLDRDGEMSVTELSESGKAIREARSEIIARLSEPESLRCSPSTHELIQELANNRDRNPYRAAITSLIASGEVEASSTWKLRLTNEPT